MVLKSVKSDPPGTFALLFYNQIVYQKSVWHFLDQVARDGKSHAEFW